MVLNKRWKQTNSIPLHFVFCNINIPDHVWTRLILDKYFYFAYQIKIINQVDVFQTRKNQFSRNKTLSIIRTFIFLDLLNRIFIGLSDLRVIYIPSHGTLSGVSYLSQFCSTIKIPEVYSCRDFARSHPCSISFSLLKYKVPLIQPISKVPFVQPVDQMITANLEFRLRYWNKNFRGLYWVTNSQSHGTISDVPCEAR